MKKNSFIEYSSEAGKALERGKPAVALETTMFSHGAPYPQNFELAKKVGDTVRGEGATPAFIAVIGGKMKVGLTDDELEYICRAGSDLKKAGARDLALLAASGDDGAATASAAMFMAGLAGIRVVALGGIGGVHRGGEDSMDVSADLEELSRTPVMAVTAGPKTILDAGLTLEYLETRGVPVIGYGTDELPAYYTRTSGYKTDYTLTGPAELAKAMRAAGALGVGSGMLVANPVPERYALDASVLGRAIDIAVGKAAELGIRGRELTPFLLTLIKEMTGGKSAEADAAVALGNAKLAAQTAVVLSAISDTEDEGAGSPAGDAFRRSREEMRAEMSDMFAAYMAGRAPQPVIQPQYVPQQPLQPQYAPQPAPQYAPAPQAAAPAATVGSGAPILDDRPFIPFVPGQKNDRHGPVKTEEEPAPEEQEPPKHEIPAEYRADGVPEYSDEPEPIVVEETVTEETAEAVEAVETVETVEAEEVPETQAPEEEPAAQAAPEEPEQAPEDAGAGGDSNEFTVYDPNKYRAKHEAEKQQRQAEVQQGKAEPEEKGGLTEYDPDLYHQRALEKKRRMAIASGEDIPDEAKTEADRQAEAVAMVDCKGPLEFTGEHPLAWKCTRCGQLFEKHEIPHKRPKTPQDE